MSSEEDEGARLGFDLKRSSVGPITSHVGDVVEVDMCCFVTEGDELVKRCVLWVDPYRLCDRVGFSVGSE